MVTKDNKYLSDKDISHPWIVILEELCKRYPTIAKLEHGFNFIKNLAHQIYERGEIDY
jgi:hypothetical protein